jgi:protein-disulfide isomerase
MNRSPRALALFLVLTLAVTAACGTDAEGAATTDAAATPVQDSARAALIRRADLGRIKGADTTSTWLVVISDFQCPYCKVWHDETAPRIHREYVSTGKIRIAYLNLPITSHRNAWPAHEAAMCAAEQERFWPVADALFATQKDWKGRGDAVVFFDSLTTTLDLDHARLRACIADGQLKPLIKADYDRSSRLGVGSTPSFLIGKQMLIGAQPFEAFKRAIDEALAKGARAHCRDEPVPLMAVRRRGRRGRRRGAAAAAGFLEARPLAAREAGPARTFRSVGQHRARCRSAAPLDARPLRR